MRETRVLLNKIGDRLAVIPVVDFQREPIERRHCDDCGVGLLPSGLCPRCYHTFLRAVADIGYQNNEKIAAASLHSALGGGLQGDDPVG